MLIMPSFILTIADDADREYMANLFLKYRDDMYKAVKRMCNNPNDWEDIISDSLEGVFRNLKKFRTLNEAQEWAYILKAMRNTSYNYWMKRKREQEKGVCSPEEILATIPDGVDVEKKVVLMDELCRVLCITYELSEKQQEALRLKAEKGMKDEEIAQIVQISPNSVRKYVGRAREYVKERFYGDVEGRNGE